MKFFTAIATIVLGAVAVSAATVPENMMEKRCLNNGDRCRADGSWGVCCSNFCLQYQGASEGKCQ